MKPPPLESPVGSPLGKEHTEGSHLRLSIVCTSCIALGLFIVPKLKLDLDLDNLSSNLALYLIHLR